MERAAIAALGCLACRVASEVSSSGSPSPPPAIVARSHRPAHGLFQPIPACLALIRANSSSTTTIKQASNGELPVEAKAATSGSAARAQARSKSQCAQ